jgi:hypothetical protein
MSHRMLDFFRWLKTVPNLHSTRVSAMFELFVWWLPLGNLKHLFSWWMPEK